MVKYCDTYDPVTRTCTHHYDYDQRICRHDGVEFAGDCPHKEIVDGDSNS